MNAIRAFIAIDLPADIQSQLGRVIESLKGPKTSAVRWVPSNNIHLTLKFLGDISPANLNVLCSLLDTESQRFSPFEIEIIGLGAFPNIRRPRVVWVGMNAPSALSQLQHSIDTGTQRLGYTSEERSFSPHLTLGRVSHNATPRDVQQIAEILAKTTVQSLGRHIVTTVRLYRSDLNPGGAVYTPLHTSSLRQ